MGDKGKFIRGQTVEQGGGGQEKKVGIVGEAWATAHGFSVEHLILSRKQNSLHKSRRNPAWSIFTIRAVPPET